MAPVHDGALFGPDSLSARLLDESVLLLGGPRALLMQVANPKVAAGVADHSDFRADPFGRLVRTLDAMWAVAFGSPEERERTLAGLRSVHARVRGLLPGGQGYSAEDPELQLWVHATLVDTVLEVERRYLGRLDDDGRGRFYDESRALAAAFSIPGDLVPPDLRSFVRYMDGEVHRVHVSEAARRLARSILNPPVPLVPSQLWEPLRMVTVDMLPRRLREGYGLEWDARRRAVLRAGQAVARTCLPRVPSVVRNLPVTARRTLARAS